MPSIKKKVTQTGVDTFTTGVIDTGLVLDGKSGWAITSMSAHFQDIRNVTGGSYKLDAILSTVNSLVPYDSSDQIAQVSWATQNAFLGAAFFNVDPIKEVILPEQRVTVQPELFLGVSTELTGLACDVVFIVTYEIVKLTDLEVMRLFAGGA